MERLVIRVASLFVLAIIALPANAQNDAQVSDTDCQSILEAAAIAPKAVAPDVVKACQEVVAAAPAINTTASASDCSAPGAANSVHCWGGWNALAPAGAGLAPGGDSLIEPDERDLKPLLAVNGNGNDPFPPLPIEGCTPGASCGFSITATGLAPPTEVTARLEKFELAEDARSFVSDPGGPNEVQSSLEMSPVFAPIPDPATGMYFTQAQAIDFGTGEVTAIFAHTNCDPCVAGGTGSTIYFSEETWQNRDANGVANNGVFGWGIATSQADINNLNAGSATVSFSGAMSLNTDTNATITMMFGGAPTWSGNFADNGSGNGHNFTAGGRTERVNFVADPTQFSSNVVNPNDAIVQGALLGRAGDQAVVVAYDVVLAGPGRVADAGLLVQD
jgi:hypothetical protein